MLSYRKKRKAFLPRSSSAEKISRRGGERYPTTKVHANADETLSARIRAQQRSNRTRLDIFIVFPPSYDSTRDCARHILSLRFPDTGRKRKPKGESNPIRARAKKGKRAFRNPTTYRLRDSLRGRFSAHGRDRDASVRDLGDRGHYYCVCVCVVVRVECSSVRNVRRCGFWTQRVGGGGGLGEDDKRDFWSFFAFLFVSVGFSKKSLSSFLLLLLLVLVFFCFFDVVLKKG